MEQFCSHHLRRRAFSRLATHARTEKAAGGDYYKRLVIKAAGVLKNLRRQEHYQLVINFRTHWIKRSTFALFRQAVSKCQSISGFQERRRRRLKEQVLRVLRERKAAREQGRCRGREVTARHLEWQKRTWLHRMVLVSREQATSHNQLLVEGQYVLRKYFYHLTRHSNRNRLQKNKVTRSLLRHALSLKKRVLVALLAYSRSRQSRNNQLRLSD